MWEAAAFQWAIFINGSSIFSRAPFPCVIAIKCFQPSTPKPLPASRAAELLQEREFEIIVSNFKISDAKSHSTGRNAFKKIFHGIK
jgi:hypothetical protein